MTILPEGTYAQKTITLPERGKAPVTGFPLPGTGAAAGWHDASGRFLMALLPEVAGRGGAMDVLSPGNIADVRLAKKRRNDHANRG
jgi:hypothetical protein